MDDTDADRVDEGPFDGELTPAVSRVDDGTDREVADVDDLIGPRRTLEPAVQAIWMIRAAVTAAVIGLVAGVAFAFLPVGGTWVGSAWVGGGVFVVLLIVGVVFSVLRYRNWSYEVREDSLYLERGVVTRVRTVVPYVRIQHVDASRGPLERIFGLATTVVYTAGSRGADVSIPGLTPDRSTDLQTRLKQLAIASEGEDAV